jgi:hypothetical protein
MTLTIDSKTVRLDGDQTDNLISDLADLSTDIDTMLNAEDKQAQIEALLNRLNLIADVYS